MPFLNVPLPSLIRSALGAWVLSLIACGPANDSVQVAIPSSEYPGMEELDQPIDVLATPCEFTVASQVALIVVADNETAHVSKRLVDNALLVNQVPCGQARTSSLKKLQIQGSSGPNTVILDFIHGTFGLCTALNVGLDVDLSGGNDALKLRGSAGPDTVTFGILGVAFNTDPHLDLTYANVESIFLSAGPGNDTLSGQGGFGTGGAYTQPLDAAAGSGNDLLKGGLGDDILRGDEGADLFLQGADADGADTFVGGPDIDTVSYALRTTPVSAVIAGGAVSGSNSEKDTVSGDIEVLLGGLNDDTLEGDGNDNTVKGGPGNDVLRGHGGNDSLWGEEGDDVFDEGATGPNGADTFVGGAGTDLLSYAGRTQAVSVSMDGVAANDGEASENDSASADVENLEGGQGDDVLVGNVLNNLLRGGMGNDRLSGGAGNDVFDEGALANGNDTFVGGLGLDLLDYSSRTHSLTVTMDGLLANDGAVALGEADNVGADIENLLCGSGTNQVTGNSFDNFLKGNSGSDTLNGAAGNDTLSGEAGNDTLLGGPGDDLLDGGGGFDSLNGEEGSGDICYGGTSTNCELDSSPDPITPSTPVLTGVNPTSPANNNAPSVSGTADPLVTVRLYHNNACSGTALVTGVTNNSGDFNLTVNVSDNGFTNIYARAQSPALLTSACSTQSITYVEDSTSPARPTVVSVFPMGPANNNTPTVYGSAEASSTVRLHSNASCSSGPLGVGVANGGGSFGIMVTVADNTVTRFYARSFDAAGNASACSVSSVQYTETTP